MSSCKIFLATDRSADANLAAQTAAYVSKGTGCEQHVVRVLLQCSQHAYPISMLKIYFRSCRPSPRRGCSPCGRAPPRHDRQSGCSPKALVIRSSMFSRNTYAPSIKTPQVTFARKVGSVSKFDCAMPARLGRPGWPPGDVPRFREHALSWPKPPLIHARLSSVGATSAIAYDQI